MKSTFHFVKTKVDFTPRKHILQFTNNIILANK